MQVVVRRVDGDEAEHIGAGHEAENGDDRVDETEDDQVLAGERRALAGGKQADKTADQVDQVMRRIGFKNTENGIIEEPEDADERQDEAEHPSECGCHSVEVGKGKLNVMLSEGPVFSHKNGVLRKMVLKTRNQKNGS